MRSQHLIVSALALLFAATWAQASVEINGNPTKNMNCAGGICSPTAKSAVLNTTDLANMLATSDVKITTGNGAVTITVSGPFSWTSTHRLTLDADVSVSFRAPVEVAGQGAVTILTNDGGTGGDLLFFPGGKLDFWDLGSSLNISGSDYVLVNSIAMLKDLTKGNPAGNYAFASSYDANHDSFHRSPVRQLDGVFEGLGQTIDHVKITNGIDCFGLIGTNQGTVRDITLTNVSVSSGRAYSIGPLIGCNNGLMRNVGVTGSVNSSGYPERNYVGGLAGSNYGQIEHSSSSASVNVQGIDGFAGGLVGWNHGSIAGSHATGAVYGFANGDVGGFVGASDGTITLSYSTGDVSGAAQWGGGFAGFIYYDVSQCFETGNVALTGGGVGGFAGLGQKVSNSYSTGSVQQGGQLTGGFLSGSDQSISNSYSIGTIAWPSGSTVGGSIGYGNPGTVVTNVFWELSRTSKQLPGCGKGECTGTVALKAAQFKSGLPSGFDPAIWGQNPDINNGYPYLIANPPQ